jgi:putative ABC transport system permease protein
MSNWRRRPLRTGVTAAGVAIGVAALFSLLEFQRGYHDGLQAELGRLGAHVLVVPKGCPYDAASIALHGASWPCYLKAEYLKEVRAIPTVGTAAPVFMLASYEAEGRQAVFLGVDTNILKLKPAWRIQGHFPQVEGELLIGAEVSRQRSWQVGRAVVLPAAAGSASGIVSGILAPTHGPDDGFIFLRLIDAERRFRHVGELTHILVRLKDPDDLDQTVAQLRGCEAGMEMNVVPLAHLFRSIQTLVNSTRVWLGCVAVVALLAAAGGVANAILMAVAERTREIGVMRALGASTGDIFCLIWLETVQVCLVGCAVGLCSAFLASRSVESWLRARLPFAPTDPLLRWEWVVVAACFGCALVLGSLAGFLPAWKASRLSPMAAMRSCPGSV